MIRVALIALVLATSAADSGCESQKRTCTCPTVIAQVCGTNGTTYGNPCESDCAGATVAHPGACEADAGTDAATGGGGGHGSPGGAAGGNAGTAGNGGKGGNGGNVGAAGAAGAACPGPAPVGCCLRDNDCSNAVENRCVTSIEVCQASSAQAGVCERHLPNDSFQCWTDADCFGQERCFGATICPCGAACLVADEPGECTTR